MAKVAQQVRKTTRRTTRNHRRTKVVRRGSSKTKRK